MRDCIAAISKPDSAAVLGQFLEDLAHTPVIEPDTDEDFSRTHPVENIENMYFDLYWG
jgi:hypothetical protein